MENRLKLLHVIRSFRNGGAENQLFRLLKHNKNKDIVHYVFLLENVISIPDFDLPENVHFLFSFRKLWLLNIVLLVFQIIQVRPSTISAWMYLSCTLASVLKYLHFYKGSVVWNIRSTDFVKKGINPITVFCAKAMPRLSIKACDLILYNSQASRLEHERIGYAKFRGNIIANGLDFESIPTLSNKNYKKEKNEFVVGSLGRFNEYKDYETLCRSMALCLSSKCNISFILGGYGIDKHNHELVSILNKYGIPDMKCRLIGPVLEKKEFFDQIDLFVLHSRSESFPNVLLEAIAFKKLCVTTDVGCAKELLNDTDDVVEVQNPNQMAEKFVEMINIGDDAVKHKVETNYKNAYSLYNVDLTVSKYEEYILSTLK